MIQRVSLKRAQTRLEGVQVTTYAFQNGLPFSNQFCAAVLMICLVFFAFTTILGWDYYGERCLEYLTGKDEKKIKIYHWLYILAVFIGPYSHGQPPRHRQPAGRHCR